MVRIKKKINIEVRLNYNKKNEGEKKGVSRTNRLSHNVYIKGPFYLFKVP